MTHVFISYVREDQDEVDHLCNELQVAGIDVWLDRDKINPGQRWKRAIRIGKRGGSVFYRLLFPGIHKSY